LFIFLSITYMAICVYWSLFRLRLFNFYRLIPHQQTDPSSLMFCALYVISPPPSPTAAAAATNRRCARARRSACRPPA
jgi:hypothetical protein